MQTQPPTATIGIQPFNGQWWGNNQQSLKDLFKRSLILCFLTLSFSTRIYLFVRISSWVHQLTNDFVYEPDTCWLNDHAMPSHSTNRYIIWSKSKALDQPNGIRWFAINGLRHFCSSLMVIHCSIALGIATTYPSRNHFDWHCISCHISINPKSRFTIIKYTLYLIVISCLLLGIPMAA